jgi:hypothetical protein
MFLFSLWHKTLSQWNARFGYKTLKRLVVSSLINQAGSNSSFTVASLVLNLISLVATAFDHHCIIVGQVIL